MGSASYPIYGLLHSVVVICLPLFGLVPSINLVQVEVMKRLLNFLKDEDGQDLIEYTLLIAFVALASAVIFVGAGTSVSSIWGTASNNLTNAATSAS